MWLCALWLAVALRVCAWAFGHSMRIILTWCRCIDVCVGNGGVIHLGADAELFTCSRILQCHTEFGSVTPVCLLGRLDTASLPNEYCEYCVWCAPSTPTIVLSSSS